MSAERLQTTNLARLWRVFDESKKQKGKQEYRRVGRDDPIEDWAKPIIVRGPRPMFEMEQVLPDETPGDPFDDPITRSNDLKDAGRRAEAEKILMAMCRADLRCLDAHSHLGNFVFDYRPQDAIQHYEVGLRIGELSLGNNFTGLLPWGFYRQPPVFALHAWLWGKPLRVWGALMRPSAFLLGCSG